MISTLSKQGGRRYPQMGSTGLAFHGWLPSVGGTITPPTPPAPASATPGFLGRVRDLDERRRYETEAEKEARRIREGTLPALAEPVEIVVPDVSAEYAEKSARLAAAIAKARGEAEASRKAIAKLEAAQVKRQTQKLQRDLIRAQQALQLAQVQEAVLLEEMEVMDVAFCASVALTMVLQ